LFIRSTHRLALWKLSSWVSCWRTIPKSYSLDTRSHPGVVATIALLYCRRPFTALYCSSLNSRLPASSLQHTIAPSFFTSFLVRQEQAPLNFQDPLTFNDVAQLNWTPSHLSYHTTIYLLQPFIQHQPAIMAISNRRLSRHHPSKKPTSKPAAILSALDNATSAPRKKTTATTSQRSSRRSKSLPYKIPRGLKKAIKKNLVKIVKDRRRKMRDEEVFPTLICYPEDPQDWPSYLHSTRKLSSTSKPAPSRPAATSKLSTTSCRTSTWVMNWHMRWMSCCSDVWQTLKLELEDRRLDCLARRLLPARFSRAVTSLRRSRRRCLSGRAKTKLRVRSGSRSRICSSWQAMMRLTKRMRVVPELLRIEWRRNWTTTRHQQHDEKLERRDYWDSRLNSEDEAYSHRCWRSS